MALPSSEHQEQVAVFEWAERLSYRYPELRWLYAVPNGAKLPYRGKGKNRWSPEALRLKAEGLRPGVPDVCLPVARQGYHSLYVELKWGKNKTTEAQDEWLAGLAEQGHKTAICYGADSAIACIMDYLGIKDG